MSQVTNHAPDAVKLNSTGPLTRHGREPAARRLRDMRKAFDIEISISTTHRHRPWKTRRRSPVRAGLPRNQPQRSGNFIPAVCKNETVPNSPVDVGEVIDFYNKTSWTCLMPASSRVSSSRAPASCSMARANVSRALRAGPAPVFVPLAEIPSTCSAPSSRPRISALRAQGSRRTLADPRLSSATSRNPAAPKAAPPSRNRW